jgi:hypothetical protein
MWKKIAQNVAQSICCLNKYSIFSVGKAVHNFWLSDPRRKETGENPFVMFYYIHELNPRSLTRDVQADGVAAAADVVAVSGTRRVAEVLFHSDLLQPVQRHSVEAKAAASTHKSWNQGCQMVCFQTKNLGGSWNEQSWYIIWPFWNILRPFGIFCGHSVI